MEIGLSVDPEGSGGGRLRETRLWVAAAAATAGGGAGDSAAVIRRHCCCCGACWSWIGVGGAATGVGFSRCGRRLLMEATRWLAM